LPVVSPLHHPVLRSLTNARYQSIHASCAVPLMAGVIVQKVGLKPGTEEKILKQVIRNDRTARRFLGLSVFCRVFPVAITLSCHPMIIIFTAFPRAAFSRRPSHAQYELCHVGVLHVAGPSYLARGSPSGIVPSMPSEFRNCPGNQ
jgi:hypothetical protein